MTRAYLVVGPESSGTRLLTKILIAGGCQGTADMLQPFDHLIPPAESIDSPIVWRRSVPHAKKWPDIGELIRLLESRGYEPFAVTIYRDWSATAQSQVKAGHVKSLDEAWRNVERAQGHIARGVSSIRSITVLYEALIQYPVGIQEWIALRLGLPTVPNVDIYDGNKKWLT